LLHAPLTSANSLPLLLLLGVLVLVLLLQLAC
jgi:hypothetical protein